MDISKEKLNELVDLIAGYVAPEIEPQRPEQKKAIIEALSTFRKQTANISSYQDNHQRRLDGERAGIEKLLSHFFRILQ